MSNTQEKKYAVPVVAVPVLGGDSSGNGLDEQLVEATTTPDGGDAPYYSQPTIPEGRPHLEIVAPATLPEGYTFDAEANGQTFTVKVPMGGVKEGQKFSVPFPGVGSDVGYSREATPTRASVPVGRWKDGLCDCFRHGVIHPALWNAWCFPTILAGQVMHRLKLTWLGNEGGTIAETARTFHIMLRITVVYFAVDYVLKYLPLNFVDEFGQPTAQYEFVLWVRMILNLSYAIFTVVVVAKTRKRIRSRYDIPEEQCTGCEDCCCAYWCTCCTIAQMARHTTDYETYPGLCCSETGLSPHAHPIV